MIAGLLPTLAGFYCNPLTREDGTNRLGHVTLSDVDEDEGEGGSVTYTPPVYDSYENASRSPAPTAEEREEFARLLADLITVGAILTVWAAPHVKRLWNDKAAPALRSARDKTASGLVDAPPGRAPEDLSQRQRRAGHIRWIRVRRFPEGVATALEAYLPSMSSAEARQRLAAALIAMAVSDRARAVSDEQLGILLNARIEDATVPRPGRAPWRTSRPRRSSAGSFSEAVRKSSAPSTAVR